MTNAVISPHIIAIHRPGKRSEDAQLVTDFSGTVLLVALADANASCKLSHKQLSTEQFISTQGNHVCRKKLDDVNEFGGVDM